MRPALPLLRAAAGGALLLALAGCAGRGAYPRHPAPETLPPGSPLRSATLARGDAWLRHYLMAGDFDAALEMLAPGSRAAPGDELVRHLQLGVVLHQAGRWAESNAAFEWAEREAEDRVTRSARRALGSVLLNDGTLEYVPSPSERAMIPYHRTLNYLALGSRDEAVVEARKAGALLAAVEKPGCGDAFLPYLGGLVFGAAGERNDALVALRRSQRAWDACEGGVAAPGALGEDLFRAAALLGVREVADSARARYRIAEPAPAAGTGDLVVVVEHGWVAHRAAEDLHVPVFPDEVDGLDDDDRESLAAASGRITARLLGSASGDGPWSRPYGRGGVSSVADALAGAHVLKVAWPAYRLEASRPAALRVLVDDTVAASSLVQDVSSGVERDFAGRRAMVLARAVGRGVLKYAVAREVEKKAEKEGGEVAGFFAGRLLNLAGNVLEQADTRSWSLLPDRISLARLALPAGEHRVRIEVSRGGWDGAVDTLDLGVVVVRPGERVFRSRRVWGDEQGDVSVEERRWHGPTLAATYPDPVVRPGWEGDAIVASAPPPPPVRADAPVSAGPRDEGEPRLDVPAQRPRVVDAGPERRQRPEPAAKAERVSSAPREAPRPSVRTRPEP
ncbi:MAG TPA: hypothetical protein VF263_15990 [Longimicrobiaceae bacterium]